MLNVETVGLFHLAPGATDLRKSIDGLSVLVSAVFRLVPAQVKIVQHVRYVYGCRNCEKTGIEVPIKTEEAPKPVIEKGLASPSAVAYVMTLKCIGIGGDKLTLTKIGSPPKRVGKFLISTQSPINN